MKGFARSNEALMHLSERKVEENELIHEAELSYASMEMNSEGRYLASSEVRSCAVEEFKKVSFKPMEGSNVPIPELNVGLYASLLWYYDSEPEPPVSYDAWSSPLTSVATVDGENYADWNDDGWLTFKSPCGEDRIKFQVWADQADGGNRLMWEYQTKTAVSDYYRISEEQVSCWYVEDPFGNWSNIDDDVPVSKNPVYFKWCSKVQCAAGSSCLTNPMGPGFLAIPVSLVVLPTLLFALCACYMNLRYRSSRSMVFRWWRISNRPADSRRIRSSHPEGPMGLFWYRRERADLSVTGDDGDPPQVELRDQRRRRTGGIRNIGSTTYSQVAPRKTSNPETSSPETSVDESCAIEQEVMTSHEAIEEESCAICLVEMNPKDEVKVLPCGHVFHASCIDLWGRKADVCPLCKAVIG